ETMLAQLPPGFSPDFLFWIDSGHDEIGADIASLPFPKLAYLIDTHIATELRVDMARKFDVVFVAQKGQIEHFRQAGIKSIYWLPLACDPELHAVGEQGGPRSKRIYDVAYVGSLSTTEGERRPKLLAAVAERFPNHRIGKFWPEEMARIYARSKIVVNACHNRDVNMRVFEGMASGALLITDEADGLEDLFEEGKHFVVYHRDDDLLDLIAYYLEHEEEREQIAGAGQKLVLRNHTYRRRFDLMLSVIEPRLGAARPASGVPSPPPSAAPKSTGYYRNVRREVMERVPRLARRILDVGCGAGALGHTLKTERGVDEVVGIEVIEEAYRAACEVLDKVLFGSIEELELPFPVDYFDCIICADVLEHLEEPAAALRKLSRVLAPDGTIVISIPNIRFHDVIRMLSLGGWSYMEAGIMDSTHLRFFTRESLGTFIASAGLEVLLLERLNGLAPYQAPREPDGSMLMEKVRLRDVGDDEHLDLLTIQYAVLAGKPGVDRLKRARLALEQGDAALAVSYAVDAVGVDEAERLRLLGKAFSRLGTLDKAEYFYRESLQRRYEPNVLGELGMLLLGMNRAHEALPLLEQAHAEAPENDRVAGALGLALSVAGRLEEAYTHLLTALQASYETPTLLKHLQAVAVPLGRLAGVEPVFKSFAEFYAGDLDVACDYAELLVTLGRTREARERLEQVVLFAPEHERALFLLQGMGPP
ncbi:MAG: glycosyltransferase, partial [Candidatus Hydrogenedentes bacterium]|nr:glycosyltransferase [Candidatus Hydrogenedentota bacterium]